MKRMVALLLGIALLLTTVPALAEEEMDELNKIARKVEEEYLLPLNEGEDAKPEVLKVCLELLKDAKGGPKKKPLELYCQVLLAIEKGDFDDANYTMFVLSQGSMKKTFNQEFIEKSGGESMTSLLTIEELALYLQGREAEQNNERDAALAAYDQCNNRADAYYRIKKIEDEQYDDAIEMKRQGKYDSAKEILKKLAKRQYPWAIEDLKDWATPTPKPTPKPTATPTTVPQEVSATITVKYLSAYDGTPIADEQLMTLSPGTYSIRPTPTNLQPGYRLMPNNAEITITVYNDGTLDTDSENIAFYYEQKTAKASTPENNENFSVHLGTAVGFGGGEVTATVILHENNVSWLIIDASTQTPGIGTRCAEDVVFTTQFQGKSGPFILGENADALTGATVTSTAVVEAINAALSAPATAEKATVVSVQAFNGGYIGVGVTDEDGVITSLLVDASSQTPGLGQECENEAFTSQFIGRRAPFVLNENIDAVTGATVSSQAVVDAVNSIYGY